MPEHLHLLQDPLFLQPFLTGLIFAIILPLLGHYLRLRDEWLSALAFAQTGASGALVAMLAGWPFLLGGLLSAMLAALIKQSLEHAARAMQGASYALLLLAAWALSVLLVTNWPLAERLGHALFDGQLYFTEKEHLVAACACLVIGGGLLYRLSRVLLLDHFFPGFLSARGRSVRKVHLVFDLLVAATLAMATMSLGVMAAFALIFVPPLIAWRWAGSWRSAAIIAVMVSSAGYLTAFALALIYDQAFGPILGGTFVALAIVAMLFPMKAQISSP